MREGTKCHLERGKCHFESCFTGREIFQTGLNKINEREFEKLCVRQGLMCRQTADIFIIQNFYL